MESAKPGIKREIDTTIIAFKIAVVKLMVKMPEHHPLALTKQQIMKTSMTENRRKRQHVAMKHHKNRMRWHQKMN